MKFKAQNALLACTTALCTFSPWVAHALPQDGVVVAGSASIVTSAQAVDITQSSQKAIIDWRGFDIAPNEAARFHQPSANAITLNRVNSTSATQINGMLSANGNILIINPNGVIFGKNSRVDVGGLVASSSDVDNHAFMTKANPVFDKPGMADAKISNAGVITAREAGLVGLVAPQVENSGVITAQLGKVTLASGDTFTLDFAGDGITQIAVTGNIEKQVVKNSGVIEANGGSILLTAAAARDSIDSLIENTGVLRATSVGEREGSVVLYAEGSNAVINNDASQKGIVSGRSTVINSGTIDVSGKNAGEKGGKVQLLADQVAVVTGAVIDASGYAGGGEVEVGGAKLGEGTTPASLVTIMQEGSLIDVSSLMSGDAGSVVLWSDDRTEFHGEIKANAYGEAGDGGFVETSGKAILNAYGTVSATSRRGRKGEWFLDPANIEIVSGGNDKVTSSGANPIIWASDGTGTSKVSVTTILNSLNAGTDVVIQTGGDSYAEAGDITVSAAIVSTLGTLTGMATHSGNLTLSAYHNIYVNAAIELYGGTLTLRANNAGAADGSSGTGAISVNADITTHGGNVIMGGGSGATIWAGSGFAVGDSTHIAGIVIAADIDAGGGTIIANGVGSKVSTLNNNNGVEISGGGSLKSTGGSIRVSGVGGGTGATSILNAGVVVVGSGSAIIADGGAQVIINGAGGTGSSNGGFNYGVWTYSGGLVSAAGAGTVLTINGTGGDGSQGFNRGVVVGNGSAVTSGSITVAGGAQASITGQGGTTSTGEHNHGLYVTEYATISVDGASSGLSLNLTGGGTGAASGYNYGLLSLGQVIGTNGASLDIRANGGGGTYWGNTGVYAGAADSIRTTGGGSITIRATQGIYGFSVYAPVANAISTSGSGSVTIYADTFALDVANAFNVGGKLTIAAYNDITMGVGAASAYGLNLDDATLLSRMTAGSYQFGTLTTATGSTRTQDVALRTGLDFGTKDVTVVSGNDLTVAAAFNRTAAGSTGKLTLEAVRNITVNFAITQRGDMLLRSNSLGAADGSSGTGAIAINAALVSNGAAITLGGGAGTITAGSGYAVGNSAQAIGINIGASITVGSGTLIINGIGNKTSTADENFGVRIQAATISSNGGIIRITGIGGGTGSSVGNSGVFLGYSSGYITATGGANVLIRGTGGQSVTGDNNAGVVTAGTSKITADGAGTVLVIEGMGGGSGGSSNNYGILVGYSDTEIAATAGAQVRLTGTGGNSAGTGSTNSGTEILSGSKVTASGAGTVLIVEGIASSASGGWDSNGVKVTGVNSAITAASGANVTVTGQGYGNTGRGVSVENAGSITASGATSTLTIQGTGGGSGGMADNYGVVVTGATSTISAVDANIEIRGFGGNLLGTGGNNHGIYVNIANGIQTTGTGSITLKGIKGGQSSSYGIYVNAANGVVTSGGSGARAITLYTDTISVVANAINAAGKLTFATYSDISLGVGATTGYTLNLDDTTISRMVGGSYQFGTVLTATGGTRVQDVSLRTNVTNAGLTGKDVTVVSGHDLTVDAVFTRGVGDTGTLTLEAVRNITVNNAITQRGALLLRSNSLGAADGSSGTGAILISAALSSNGAAITLGGGTGIITAGSGYAVGISTQVVGVDITASINAGGGTIIINGMGNKAATTSNNRGVQLRNAAGISSTGGVIRINGTGGGSGVSGGNSGVLLTAGSSVIGTAGTQIYITGYGGNLSGTGTSNTGVLIEGASKVTVDGSTSSLSLQGTGGGAGSGGANNGVTLYSTNTFVSATGGATISIKGYGGAAASGDGQRGVYLDAGGQITADGTGSTVTVEGTGGGTGASIYNHGVMVYASGSAIVATNGGHISITGYGGNLTGTGSVNRGISVENAGKITADGSGSFLQLNGTGGGYSTSNSNNGITVHGTGSTIAFTNGADGTLVGQGGNSAGANRGITLENAGKITVDGVGSVVTIQGTGGGTGGGNNNHGVHITSANSAIKATAGADVTVTGYGSAVATGDGNAGVKIDSGGQITADGAGTILRVTGTGGGGSGSGSQGNHGIALYDTNTAIAATAGANVSIKGYGGSLTAAGSNRGVELGSSAKITADGATTVLAVEGTAGGTGAGNYNYGVSITGTGTSISSTNSDISITGLGGNLSGTGGSNHGVYVNVANGIQTTAGGSITLKGVKGGQSSSFGVYADVTGAIVTSGASGTRAITVYTDTINLTTSGVINALGKLTFATYGDISLGVGATTGYGLNLNDTLIGRMVGASYQFGTVLTATNGSRVQNVSLQTAIDFGTKDVTVVSGRDLTVDANFTRAAGNTGKLTLQAVGNIVVSTGFTITQRGDTLIQSNLLDTGGSVKINGSVLGNGSNITIGGGSGTVTSGSGYASGNGADPTGVLIVGQVNAGGGHIVINGRGNSSTVDYNFGINVQGGSVETSGAGTITLNGIGGGSGASKANIGVLVKSNGYVQTQNGALVIDGLGGAGSNGGSHGVGIESGGQVRTSGTGSITLYAQKGAMTSSFAVSFYDATNAIITNGTTGARNLTIYADGEINASGTTATAMDIDGTVTIAAYGDSWLGIGVTGLGTYINDTTLGKTIAGAYVFGSLLTATGGTRTQDVTLQTGVDFGTKDVTVISGRAVRVDGAFNRAAAGSTGKLTLEAVGSILVNAAITQRNDLLLRANSQGAADGSSGTGAIQINAAIASNGGAITLGGGSGTISAGSGYAVGTSAEGIRIARNISTGGGALIINGMGNRTRTGDSNVGVFITSNSAITSAGGQIDISGVGGGAGASIENWGVALGGTLTASNGAQVNISGQGGNLSGTGGNNHGIFLFDASNINTSGGSSLTLKGKRGGTGGVDLNLKAGTITGSGTNDSVTLYSDRYTGLVNGSVNIAGKLTVTTYGDLSLGVGATSGYDLNLTDTLIGYMTAGSYQFGNLTTATGGARTKDVSLRTGLDFGMKDVTVVSANSLTVDAAFNRAAGNTGKLTLEAVYNITVNNAITQRGNTLLRANSQGAADGSSGTGAIIVNAAISSNGGALTLGGGSGTITAGSGYAVGNTVSRIGVDIAASVDAGGGTLIINGMGNKTSTGDSNLGVSVRNAAKVSSAGGIISIYGVGGGGGASANNYGVKVGGSNSAIEASAGTNLTIVGNGGNKTGTGSFNYGVSLETAGKITASGSGAVLSVTGTGGGRGATTNNHGVYLADMDSGIEVKSGAQGSITGNGGNLGGTGGNNQGIRVNNTSKITADGAGTVLTITGTGGGADASEYNYGVLVLNTNSEISATAGATLNIFGTGGNAAATGGNNQIGVLVQSGGKIASTGATSVVNIEGRGKGGGTGLYNNGVYVTGAGSTISATDGNINITGFGGNLSGSGGSNHGIYVNIANGIQTTGTGSITLKGEKGGQSSSYGIYIDVANGVITSGASGARAITIYTDTIAMTASNAISAAGKLTFTTYSDISFGVGATTGYDLNLNDTLIGQMVGGSYQFGTVLTATNGARTKNVSLRTGIDFGTKDVTVVSGLTLSVDSAFARAAGGTGNLTLEAARNIYINAAITQRGGGLLIRSDSGGNNAGMVRVNAALSSNGGAITIGGGSGSTITAGNGYAVGVDSAEIAIDIAANINAGGGAIIINGRGANKATDANYGVRIRNGAKISSTNGTTGGSISIYGAGSGTNTSGYDYGIIVTGSNSEIAVSDGATATIVGTGGNTGTGGYNYGVVVENAGKITAAGSGTVLAITGRGGGSGSSASNNGVIITGSNSAISATAGANLSIKGYGGNLTGTGGYNYGVLLDSAGKVTADGSSTVLALEGTAGGANTAGQNRGIVITGANSVVALTGGAQGTITGQGGSGTGDSNYGVLVSATGKITADGAGTVLQVKGTGGGTGASTINYGIQVLDANSVIAATAGANVTVTGKGGNSTGTGNYNTGIVVENGGKVTADGVATVLKVEGEGGGAGAGSSNHGVDIRGTNSSIYASNGANIDVKGKGGNMGGTGGTNHGVYVTTANGIQTTGAGSITLKGEKGGQSSSVGVYINATNGVITNGASGTRAITVYTDTITLSAANAINAAGLLTVAPYSNTTFGVGATSGYGLSLSDATIGQMTGGSYQFGTMDTATGGARTLGLSILTGVNFGAKDVSFISNYDIILASTLTKSTGAGTANYLLRANGGISNSAGVGITASSGGINLTMYGDYDNNGSGTITLNGATTINTGTGSITANGPMLLNGDTVLKGVGVTLNGAVTANTHGTRTFEIDAGTGIATLAQMGTSGVRLKDLTVTADQMVLNGDLYGTGTVWLQPTTVNRIMSVAGRNYEDTTSNLYLTQAEVGHLVNGWNEIQLGRLNGTNHQVHLGGAGGLTTTFYDNVVVNSVVGGSYMTGNVSMQDGASFWAGSIDVVLSSTLTTDGGSVTITGDFYGDGATINTNNGAVTAGVIRTWGVGLGGTINTNGGTITIGSGSEGGTPSGTRAWVLNAGTGTINVNGSINASYSVTATAGTINLTGDWGTSTALATVSLTATNSISLPSIKAGTILVRTTGPNADITINNGKALTASNSGDAIVLAAKRNFLNNSGSATPLVLTGSGRWLVYSTTLANNTRGGMMPDASYFNINYGDTLPVGTNGQNLFLYSATTAPVITYTTANDNVTYGDNYTIADFSYSYTSGLLTGDTLATIGLSGTSGFTTTYGAGTTNASDTAYAGMINGTTGTLSSKLGYSFNFVAGSLKVDRRALTVSGIGIADKVYDGTTAATLTGTGVLNNTVSGDVVNLVATGATGAFADANADVNKAVTVGGYTLSGSASSNYTLTQPSGFTATISKKDLTVRADSKTVTYGTAVPAGTISYDGFVLSENDSVLDSKPVVSSARSGIVDAGTYAGNYTLSGGTDNNYNYVFASGTLTVNKKNLTVTADGKTVTYGTAVPTGTISYNGFISGEDDSVLDSKPVVSSARSGVVNAGTYAGNYTLSGGLDNNYNYVFVSGALTVNKKNLTVTADTQVVTYGTAVPTGTVSYNGFISGEDDSVLDSKPVVSSANSGIMNAGTYTANYTASGGLDNNYNYVYMTGNLVVIKKDLNVTANTQAVTYGTAVPTGTVSYNGFIAGEDDSVLDSAPTVSSANSGIMSAGTYVGNYTASGGSDNNYNYVYTPGNLVVNKKGINVVAQSQSVTYGTSVPGTTTLTYTGFVNGDDEGDLDALATYTVNQSGVLNAGTYANTYVAGGASDANYSFNYINGTLTVTKKTLAVVANDRIMDYGDPVPGTTTVSYYGFVNGDDEYDLDSPASGVLVLAISNPYIGTYSNAYMSQGGSDNNYSFQYIGGRLIVEWNNPEPPPPPPVTGPSQSLPPILDMNRRLRELERDLAGVPVLPLGAALSISGNRTDILYVEDLYIPDFETFSLEDCIECKRL